MLIHYRNLGVLFAFAVLFCLLYLLATEFVTEQKPKGEVLVYRRNKQKMVIQGDEEHQISRAVAQTNLSELKDSQPSARKGQLPRVEQHESTFLWNELGYEIKVKNEELKILADLEGWVQGGTLTALMVCHLPSSQLPA